MANELSMALDELLRKAQVSTDVDFLREGVRALAEALLELEVTHHVGAGRYERTPERTGERNGTRERPWDTRGQHCPAGAAGARWQLLPQPEYVALGITQYPHDPGHIRNGGTLSRYSAF